MKAEPILQDPNPIHVFGAPLDLSYDTHIEMNSGWLKSTYLVVSWLEYKKP